jgi:1-hydroxycarotenoid 3,4-desaturase
MNKIAIIGAGIGGLVAALLLAAAGREVVVCEARASPGGKLRQVIVDGAAIDAGPTVFTMRGVFEAIFAQAGLNFSDDVVLHKLDCLARHAWEDGSNLDLFAETARNVDAIGAFAGPAAAQGYTEFSRRSQKIFETLDASFMQIPQAGLTGLLRRAGPGLLGISPFASLWDELGRYFKDTRLRQLFARYSTYCGSSPFMAPATLMLIAHAEQLGVWQVEGGMYRLAEVFAARAQAAGAVFRYGSFVRNILVRNGRAAGVELADGETIEADHVIANADVAALDAGLFGGAAQLAVAGMTKGAAKSLSAMTWAVTGDCSGFPLAHHNVFFSKDYPAEFRMLGQRQLPSDPTVYVCASGAEKFFLLVNAAADTKPAETEVEQCLTRTLRKLNKCGLTLEIRSKIMTGPAQFGAKFPATGGALYGRALQGWRDPFARPGARTKLPGLVLAGGSVHPGPGLPMAAISGRIAANCVLTGR